MFNPEPVKVITEINASETNRQSGEHQSQFWYWQLRQVLPADHRHQWRISEHWRTLNL